jgi:hypothetical protein
MSMIWPADNLAKLIFKQDGVPIPKHAAAAACARADHDPRSAGSVPCPRSKTWRRSCARSRRFRRSPRSIFNLGTVAGNQRKTSGSYYTPDSLVQCLLDSALDPVVEKAIKGKTVAEAEKAILALKVCDLPWAPDTSLSAWRTAWQSIWLSRVPRRRERANHLRCTINTPCAT